MADSPGPIPTATANEFWELVASSYGMTLDEVESRPYLLELFDFEGHRYGVIDSFPHTGWSKSIRHPGRFYQTLKFGSSR